MIITDRFVMLNFGKTGTTFVRRVLRELYTSSIRRRSVVRKVLEKVGLAKRATFQELLLPNPEFTKRIRNKYYTAIDQHGAYCQIPDEFRDRQVVSVVRNPYTRLLSTYEFRHWTKNPLLDQKLIDEHFPTFPDLSIQQFIEFFEAVTRFSPLGDRMMKAGIGRQSLDFIKMFYKDPLKVYENMDANYIHSDQALSDMGDITLLRQEHLVDDLIAFLSRNGYSMDELAFIRNMQRVNVTENRSKSRIELLTPEVIEYVRTKEALTFRVLEHKGIHYKVPAEECQV